jgi:lipoprotein-anchoring transpeptidase ErfK/SrfK
VDLKEQALVAYEPTGPVYATLVSSGKPGYDTDRGTFQIRKKYITNTMTGYDPKDGVYSVSEVPWVMYYFKSYALHGTYWHNDFGTSRSHGCTNLSPVDAKWLYYWTEPTVPPRWHGMLLQKGTYVHLTR